MAHRKRRRRSNIVWPLRLTDKRRAALERLRAVPATAAVMFPPPERDQIPSLMVAGWIVPIYSDPPSRDVRYALTPDGRQALEGKDGDDPR